MLVSSEYDNYHPFMWTVRIRSTVDDGGGSHNGHRRLKQEDFHHTLERNETHVYFEEAWLREFFRRRFDHWAFLFFKPGAYDVLVQSVFVCSSACIYFARESQFMIYINLIWNILCQNYVLVSCMKMYCLLFTKYYSNYFQLKWTCIYTYYASTLFAVVFLIII